MTTRFRIKKDGIKECKEDFLVNGSILLEKLVAFSNGKCNSIRNFPYEELKRATNNFDPRQVIAVDSGYKLYKGFLQDRVISVKKFNEKDLAQYGYSFNEIVFASQTSVHKNFLKLLGCCLETEVPIIVFESVANGSLADHIYGPNKSLIQPLLWKQRLKIAIQIADAVAYLHIAFPRTIVFRNIKPLNILLDENYVAKLFDFSLAISIPEGESHVQDEVAGAMGLISPEYLFTGYFNEKHDVLCFGVFLLVLLTGQMVVDFSRPRNGEDHLLVDYVKKYTEDNLKHVIDPIILRQGSWSGKEQQMQSFIDIAFRCISKSAEDRPIMMHVSKELRQMCHHL
ncbi:hypothetical protein CRYUN_Cryun38cG0006200 [Craigia yunnanensis]